jgi:hypothetical protein
LATFQGQLAELSAKDDFPATLVFVNEDEIRRRYDIALEGESPSLSHSLDLGACQTLPVKIAGTQVVIAVVPLSECIKFPGIKDGTLFQKNVRQSLGLSNAVNKGIKDTIYGDRHRDFFFSQRNNGYLQQDGGERLQTTPARCQRGQWLPITEYHSQLQREGQDTDRHKCLVSILRDSPTRPGRQDQYKHKFAECRKTPRSS